MVPPKVRSRFLMEGRRAPLQEGGEGSKESKRGTGRVERQRGVRRVREEREGWKGRGRERNRGSGGGDE